MVFFEGLMTDKPCHRKEAVTRFLTLTTVPPILCGGTDFYLVKPFCLFTFAKILKNVAEVERN
jgi:hypothetical protein